MPKPPDNDERTSSERLQDMVNEDMGVLPDPPVHAPIHTGTKIKELASKGLKAPYKLTEYEMRELCGSVMAHIERREKGEAE